VKKQKMKNNNNKNNKKAALSKAQILKRKKCFNKKARQVDDPLFSQYDFFDPQDIIQVKYEMLRRVKNDEWTISKAAKSFGFSRPSFYSARKAFEEKGLLGLLPGTTGPKSPHKLTDKVLNYILAQIKKDNPPAPSDMVKMIKKKFGFKIHVRTIQRALKKKGKKKR
jgi:transposase